MRTIEKYKYERLKIPASVLPKILLFHFPENVDETRNTVSSAPDDEGMQGAPLLSQVVVVAVQHQAVTVPPGDHDDDDGGINDFKEHVFIVKVSFFSLKFSSSWSSQTREREREKGSARETGD